MTSSRAPMRATFFARHPIRLALSAALLSAAASPLYADSVQRVEHSSCKMENKTECPAVHVLTPMVVTANRVETDPARYTGQISTLREDDLLISPNIIENLSQIPGFETGNDYGRQSGSQFSLRGFGYQSEARVIIKQDGIQRSPSLFSNHISSFRTDPSLLKQVEVVKGGSSVLHGGGAIGGIVSMSTKDAHDFLRNGDTFGVTLGARHDSNNANEGYVALAVNAEKLPIDLVIYRKEARFGDVKLANNGAFNTDGQRITHAGNDEDISHTFFKGGWDINGDQRLTLSYYKYDQDMVTTWQTLWHLDPAAHPVYGNLQQRDVVLDYYFNPAGNDWINLDLKLYDTDASYLRNRYTPSNIHYINQDERRGFNLQNTAIFSTNSLSHLLVTGLDYEEREEDALFIVDGDASDFGSFPNYYKDLGFYIQDIVGFGDFEITLGGRFDQFKRGVNLAEREEYTANRFSPKAGLSYEIMDGFYLLSSYAETFRGPTPNETSASGALNPHYWYVPNNDLKPEIAKEFEMGFALSRKNLLGNDELFLKATWFDGDIKDMISLERSPELGTPPDIGDGHADYREFAQYKNISNAKRRGYEVEARYRISDWNFSGGYDHLKLRDGQTGALLRPSTDKLFLNGSYMYQPWGLTTGLRITHWFEPKRDSYIRTVRGQEYHYIKDDFTIVDLRGSWKPSFSDSNSFARDLVVNFGINNLFDDVRIHANNYETTTSVGKGRNAYLALEKYF